MFSHTFRRFLLILSFILGPFSHYVYADQDYIKPYGDLLSEYVTLGQKQGINAALVDYQAWGKDAKHKQALEALLAVDPTMLEGDDKMAYWINAYNLLTVDLIVKTGEQESIKNQGSFF